MSHFKYRFVFRAWALLKVIEGGRLPVLPVRSGGVAYF
jgi:hypothetical protein